jgi:hypothetical protein
MKNTILIWPVTVGVFLFFCGCAPKRMEPTGFLSDYSRLEAQSGVSYRWIAPGNPLGRYSKFIIDPVVAEFYTGSKAIEKRSKGQLTEEELTNLTTYMHSALVKAIEDRYGVVYRPGPGTARVRVALTDLKKSSTLQNIIPISKAVGTGLGGATLEAEIIDSQTGEQLAAVVESQLGERLSLEGLSKWGDAKAIMDRWAKRFRQRLDEAHAG